MINLTFKAAKEGFFDRKKVMSAVDRATRKVLSKFGAFVRTRAKTSIRKRKGISTPGSPPSSHQGNLKRFIYFSYDQTRKSVVVGPIRLASTIDPESLPALEYGGLSTLEGRRGQVRKVRVKARPFMLPAFQAEKPGLPAMWRDSVR